MDGKYGIGKTVSTKVEYYLRNEITVSFSDKNDSYTNIGSSKNSQYCMVKSNYFGKRRGSHIVDYFVADNLVYTFADPWYFDFFGDWGKFLIMY